MVKQLFTFLSVVFFVNTQGNSQNHQKLCICFDEFNENITIASSEDSTRTAFRIVREGFESEESRKKAMEEHKQNLFEPYPYFYYSFFSTQKPEFLDSLNFRCSDMVELNIFRKDNYRKPAGSHSSLYILLKELPNGYLKWDAVIEPTE